MLAAGASPLLIVVGCRAAEIVQACSDLAVEPLVYSCWEAGIGGSSKFAAPHVDDDQPTLIAGCDQPGLELHHLEQLIAHTLLDGHCCAATRQGDRLGIPALVPGASLKDAGKRGDRGLGERLSSLPADRVHVFTDPVLRFDLDTESDVAIARHLVLLDG